MTPRQAAVLSLNSCFKNDKFVNLELDSAIKKYGFEGVDKSFFTMLLYGTCEKIITLDYIISLFSKIEISKLEPLVKCILRTAVYQIFYMDRVPDSAACNESVEICKSICPKSSAGFINAILRNIIREKDKVMERISKLKGLKGISIKNSVPEGIISIWEQDYGLETAEKISIHMANEKPYLSIRTNILKARQEYLLEKFGEIAEKDNFTKSGIRINGSIPVKDLYGFDSGWFFVQDSASIKASEILCENDFKVETPLIIDTCACPGGKSLSTAINFKNDCKIIAMDLHQNRLKLISDSAIRLGITCIETKANDAKIPIEEFVGKADLVICDVPCSGFGVIAKKPDIKYKDLNDIKKLPNLQYSILCESAKYLKEQGIIVYSTCTLRKAENEEIIEKFLNENPDFSLCPFELSNQLTSGFITLFPHIHNTDGFFMAKLKKDGHINQ